MNKKSIGELIITAIVCLGIIVGALVLIDAYSEKKADVKTQVLCKKIEGLNAKIRLLKIEAERSKEVTFDLPQAKSMWGFYKEAAQNPHAYGLMGREETWQLIHNPTIKDGWDYYITNVVRVGDSFMLSKIVGDRLIVFQYIGPDKYKGCQEKGAKPPCYNYDETDTKLPGCWEGGTCALAVHMPTISEAKSMTIKDLDAFDFFLSGQYDFSDKGCDGKAIEFTSFAGINPDFTLEKLFDRVGLGPKMIPEVGR